MLGERAAPDGQSARPSLTRSSWGAVLVDPDGIQDGQDGDAAGQPATLGPRGDHREHDRRGGDGVLRRVVLAQREDVQAEPFGQADTRIASWTRCAWVWPAWASLR